MHLDAEYLAASSRKWMEAAFAAFADGPSSEGMAVHHAGVATEHLLKAFLAQIHPSLVVDGNDLPSLLYAAGKGELLQVKGSQVKTIQLGEAHDRARKLLPKIPDRPRVRGSKAWPLADARNGVAHAGYHDRGEVIEVFVSCIKVIDPLLVELGIDADYWGPHKAMHDKLLLDEGEAARVRLEQKLAKARRVFAERYGHLREQERALVLTTVVRTITPKFVDDWAAPAVCPACAWQGSLMGRSYVDTEKWTVMLSPHIFRCFVCDLRVESEELDLLAQPLGDDVDLQIDVQDYWSEAEPDPDFEHDREDDEPDESGSAEP
ncbi:hypothetical protein ABZ580_30825 [Streptomyces sp. NPDC012486]|uniref:hypothetical protein n=1 Tax=Streptomyces sp. NPDC012486 TaxID=3156669 RepID=UPI0033EC289F